jgi:hypothetical protein
MLDAVNGRKVMNDKYNLTPEEREEMNYVMQLTSEARAQLEDKEAMEALVRSDPRAGAVDGSDAAARRRMHRLGVGGSLRSAYRAVR